MQLPKMDGMQLPKMKALSTGGNCLRWTATYLNSNFTITFCQSGSTSPTSISSPCDANLPEGTSEVKPRNVIQFPEDGYLTSNKIMTLREGRDPPSSQTTTESSPVSEGPKALASKTNEVWTSICTPNMCNG